MKTKLNNFRLDIENPDFDFDKASVKRWSDENLAVVRIPFKKGTHRFSIKHPEKSIDGTAGIDGGYISFRFDPYIFNRIYIDNKKEHTAEDTHLEMYLEAVKIIADEKDTGISDWQKKTGRNYFKHKWYGINPEEALKMTPASYPSDRFFSDDRMLVKAIEDAVEGKPLSNGVFWFRKTGSEGPHFTVPEWHFDDNKILCITEVTVESEDLDKKIADLQKPAQKIQETSLSDDDSWGY